MTRNIPILIPGERFDLDVTLCPDGSLSPIEQLVINAVMAGEKDFNRLVDLFGLGRRPMLDLISDLWQSGYLYLHLDMEHPTVEVADDIREKIRTGKAAELLGARRETRLVSLVHDLFAGHILPILSMPMGTTNPLTVPNLKDYGTYKDIPLPRMSDAIEYVLSTRRDTGAMRIVGSALRGVSELAEAGRIQRWFTAIEIRVEQTDSGRFLVRVVHPGAIDGRIRQDWEGKLAQYIDEQPDSLFAKRLREHADQIGQVRAAAPSDLSQEIEAFQNTIADFTPESGNILSSHGKWLNRAKELSARVNEHAAGRVRANFIEPEGLEENLFAVIDRAQHQLVICSPNPDYVQFQRFEGALRRALERRVRVFLLRDIRTDRELDPMLRRAFNDLAGSGGFFWTRQHVPTRTNERFLIRDRDEVIFTTARFLDRRSNRRCAFTVLIRGLEDKKACGLTGNLLGRIQRNLADHRLVNNFQVEPGGARLPDEYLVAGEAGMPALPRPPPASNTEGDNQAALQSTAMDLWRESWNGYAAALTGRYAALAREDISRPIFDGQHGDLLTEMLTPGSTRDLLIASGSVSHRVLTPEIGQRIRACALDGMRIVLILGRIPDDEVASKRIGELRRDCTGFDFHVVPGCGGLLVSDEKLVITSVDLLAKDMQFDSRQGARQLESGILFTGAGLLSKWRDGIAGMYPGLAGFISRLPAGEQKADGVVEEPEQGRGDITGAIRVLFDRIMEARREDGDEDDPVPRVMADWFRQQTEQDAYWQYLDELGEYLEPRLHRMAIATALLEATDVRMEEKGYSHWLERLTVERWQAGKFVEVLLLMEHGDLATGDRESLPPPWIAELAVLRDGDQEAFRLALMGAQEKKGLIPEGIDALLCIAVPALLANGTIEAHDAILMFKDRRQSGLIDWIGPVLDYWNDTGKPLPAEALRDREGAELAREREYVAFGDLQAAFNDANPTDLIKKEISLVQETWERLFSPEGEYGPLAFALDAKDSETLRELLARWRTKGMTAEQIMDDASKQVWTASGSNPIRDKRIIASRRRKYLKKLTILMEAMKTWIEARDSLVQVENSFLIERAEQLADELRTSRAVIDGLLTVWREAEDFRAPLLHRWREQMREILGV
uniref:Uncharacterized protein n=1 Tax=Candidatus Kentrum sp. DK TaxID=2126562 RepID=A0A450RTE3_9GAMM|nr:MAG: hypothetical protein BECKDK2373B_GA0170837_100169 [Candidatus Kentron sp. DK]VFJ48105.1 MAG: hypothetical protein BECKDK2373C_GA0170839_10209 [Candidatus Kentron sp. DK]